MKSDDQMESVQSIALLVESEIAGIADARVVAGIRELRVVPHPVNRAWDYGEPGDTYICWLVLEHAVSNTGIAYCSEGFGPSYPWGLIFLSGTNMTMGMDCQWYVSLEQAFRESMAWTEPSPDGYEVL